jgi:hypothetical protein
MRFDIPAYDSALFDLIEEAHRTILRHHSIIGEMSSRRTIHAGPTRNVSGEQPLDQPMASVTETMEIDWTVVRRGDMEAFAWTIVDFSMRYKDQIEQSLFKTITETTEHVGNTISAGGQPLSVDIIIDLLEKVDTGFDEEGNPLQPALMMHPDTARQVAALKPTPDQLQRMADIKRRRKEEYLATKRTRRLSD